MDIDVLHMKCIAIMGGTFNPVHIGHVRMAEEVLFLIHDIDRLVFMPNNLPAYKDKQELIDAEHRINMLKLALAHYPDMTISTLEIDRGGVTYTADTLDELLRINPHLKIYFIMGMDSLKSLHLWHRYKDVVDKCHLLVFDRDTDKHNDIDSYIYENAKIEYIHNDKMDVSSSEIRELISDGNIPYKMLPDGVSDYIIEHGLYVN